MSKLPAIDSVTSVYLGKDPLLDAWLLFFLTENNIEHSISPLENASPEQLRFMVDLEDDQVFAPCSDWMLNHLLRTSLTDPLVKEYRQQWRKLIHLVRQNIEDRYTRQKIISLSRHKFHQAVRSTFMIPSRLIKQLVTIFMTQCAIEDPMRQLKKDFNQRARDYINSPSFFAYTDSCPQSIMDCKGMSSLRWEMDLMELQRLICLSTSDKIWDNDGLHPVPSSPGRDSLTACRYLEQHLTPLMGPDRLQASLRLLFLPDTSGGLILDILLIKSLLKQGHRIVLALKDGFYFDSPRFWDCQQDPVLADMLKDAFFLSDPAATKNDLLEITQANSLVVIPDGTRERLNLYRTSITFARAWKESDLIIAKGNRNYRRLLLNTHKFTRDILCFFRNSQGTLNVYFKEKSPRVKKYSDKEIIAKAAAIIAKMRLARQRGDLVMFFSAIIGSIPGQTQIAIRILNTFVDYLRSKLANAFIINPAEYFEPGMDGDDLMYMWEKVQRSGYIDVWRFQSFADIEKSFELLGQQVPSVWAGKDATFSTGCTQEMQIALDVQKSHPEMQIIGPASGKFFRRRSYGVGKLFDSRIPKRNRA